MRERIVVQWLWIGVLVALCVGCGTIQGGECLDCVEAGGKGMSPNGTPSLAAIYGEGLSINRVVALPPLSRSSAAGDPDALVIGEFRKLDTDPPLAVDEPEVFAYLAAGDRWIRRVLPTRTNDLFFGLTVDGRPPHEGGTVAQSGNVYGAATLNDVPIAFPVGTARAVFVSASTWVAGGDGWLARGDASPNRFEVPSWKHSGGVRVSWRGVTYSNGTTIAAGCDAKGMGAMAVLDGRGNTLQRLSWGFGGPDLFVDPARDTLPSRRLCFTDATRIGGYIAVAGYWINRGTSPLTIHDHINDSEQRLSASHSDVVQGVLALVDPGTLTVATWATFGSLSSDRPGLVLAAAPDGNALVVGGTFSSTLDVSTFEPNSNRQHLRRIVSSGKEDGFVLLLQPNGPTLRYEGLFSIGGTGSDTVMSVAWSADLLVAGTISTNARDPSVRVGANTFTARRAGLHGYLWHPTPH